MPVALGREFYQTFRWFNTGGFNADIAALRRDYPQLRLRTLEDWPDRQAPHHRLRR